MWELRKPKSPIRGLHRAGTPVPTRVFLRTPVMHTSAKITYIPTSAKNTYVPAMGGKSPLDTYCEGSFYSKERRTYCPPVLYSPLHFLYCVLFFLLTVPYRRVLLLLLCSDIFSQQLMFQVRSKY